MESQSLCFMRCPPDILLEIFDHLLPSTDNFTQRHTELTTLRAVCRYWDAVITATPQYWASIYVHFPTRVIPLSTIQNWLSRSSDASLNISIKDRPPVTWTSTVIGFRTELISVIDSYISHCRSLQFEITLGILPGFRALRINKAERLESFEIDMRGNIDADVHSYMLQQLTSLSSLRHLSITTHFPLLITRLLEYADPSWLGRLASIKISCPTTTLEMAEVMRKCTSASHITLNTAYRQHNVIHDILSTVPTTTLPHLHSLDISLSSNAHDYLFRFISFPNLKSLKISGLDVSDLSSTIHFFTSPLEFLKARIIAERNNIHEVFTLLNNPSILRLPILEIESRDYESWTEYGGWNDIDDQLIHQAVEEFNKLHEGLKMMKYHSFSKWYRGYLISWAGHKEDMRGYSLDGSAVSV